jgi:hypothetical protein
VGLRPGEFVVDRNFDGSLEVDIISIFARKRLHRAVKNDPAGPHVELTFWIEFPLQTEVGVTIKLVARTL